MAASMEPAASATCLPTFIVGLSEVMGSWKTAPAYRRRASRRSSSLVPTLCPPSGGKQPEGGEAEDALAGARLPDEADDLAGGDVQGHPPQGFHGARKGDGQVP